VSRPTELSERAAPASPWQRRNALWLLLVFLLALAPRLYSALTVGWHWDGPGSFTLVNFDEGGSCRAALDGFSYSPFVGHQTLAIARALGQGPPADIAGRHNTVKAYCHGPEHIRVARVYSALTGALTAVLLGVIGLQLLPAQPAVGLTAGALLALSGFHLSESHSGTVDAPSVFFIYLFFAVMVFAALGRRPAARWSSPLFLVAAVWTKYWVFALFSYLALCSRRVWDGLGRGWTPGRLLLAVLGAVVVAGCVTNRDFPAAGYPLLALFYLLVPWRGIARWSIPLWLLLPPLAWLATQPELIAEYTRGGPGSRFGAGYGAIGWHKWLRNLLNLPVVLVLGLGLPAALCLVPGLRALWRALSAGGGPVRGWLCLAPVAVFALFALVLMPVTYYRHYLPLLPAAALLAALGYWSLLGPRRGRRWLLPFLAWPALLALDVELDYHRDPRIALRDWYAERRPQRVLATYYVSPPASTLGGHAIFDPRYAAGDGHLLRQAQYLLLSENWYDTAFANELNGPLVNDLDKLVKTTPERATFYRRALAGEVPALALERVLPVRNFMPELWLHKRWYGTFQLFVGDIRIYRIRGTREGRND
jgi:hypothetical protein